ncbi:right-handed parallel beta-helix repeat-containing protein [Mariniblastus fucicola]|uniref:Uncharacterized protein n=1 Tax=Mariniblastus fucicola TaxID=980251 RepID=A0A5B9PFQ8_9BACT|nr:right-handed parallel beta-helix repeat-containing protein [Mariniblastus fucicola]QEG23466.1 hypothetical protein MFFC18_33650 [Mariniblastus fucicola]
MPFQPPRSVVACAIFLATLITSHALQAQTLLDVNFDQRSSGTSTESDVTQEFGTLSFSNGVDEGRVQIVSGEQAYGGSGACLRVNYPAGGSGPGAGGAQWLVELDEQHDEVWLVYRVKFGSNFDFVRGGKLPGLAGGQAPSGSVPADGWNGWTGRLMWRTDFESVQGQPQQTSTKAISYAKHVNSGYDQNGKQEDTEYFVERDGTEPVLQAGVWYTIRQHVRMNTPRQRDGLLRIWIDGRLVIDRDDVKFRNTADLGIDRFFFSTFFGGDYDWRASKDEYALFDDFKISVPEERRVPEQYASVGDAVSAANPGDTVLPGSADWYDNLYLDKPLTIRGRGDSKLMGARGDRPVIQVDSEFVKIENLEIARGSVGVEAYGTASELQIQNCAFTTNFGDAIRATGCRNVSIENCTLTSNYGRGVLLDGVEGFYISNCSAIDSGGAGFELFSNGGFVSNCDAIGNRAGAGFFYIGESSGFQNNYASDNQGMGYLLVNSRFNGFMNNAADRNTTFGLLAYAVDDSYFAENLVERSGNVGAIFDNAKRNLFQFNNSSNNSGIGAYFSPSTQSNYMRGNGYQGNAYSLGLIDEGSNFVDP